LGKSQKEDELNQTIIRVTQEKKPTSVEQLVNLLKEQTGVPEQKIMNQIIMLQSQGKITLKEPTMPQPQTLLLYLKTKETCWYWITLTVAVATSVVALIVPEGAQPLVYVRYFLGTIFVLWLPGYCFTRALFPVTPQLEQASKSLDQIERTALSLGMSLALVPLVGLLLNYTPWGIRLAPIVLSLLLLTVIFASAAVIREYKAKK